ncbi:DMT family transporter [Pseudomonas sp. RW10S2]|uniref:DMT family transporter n=1 Tax=Pseudomonas sp. RW10S2 TaxID=459637 RepID=UPI001646FCF4|nr:DMT family transporter [Pseudomonas sp. RW10S2]MBC3465151.1 DMT family transporter [Pseudomonas sp. RW10S2]
MRSRAAYLFPFLAILIWSGNVIVSRLSAHSIGPGAITFYRLLLAVLIMSLFVAVPAWKNRAVIWPHLGKLAILGFLALCFFQVMSYTAAASTTATNLAVFTALTPLLTLILGAIVLKHSPTPATVGCGVVSFLGLIYLVSKGEPASLFSGGAHIGDLLIFIAALGYALYGVLLKRWELGLSSWQSTYMQSICALVIMLPAYMVTPAAQRQLNVDTVPLILYAGGLASVALPFFWVRGVQLLGPGRCAAFMNLLPVLTAVIAVIVLGEAVRGYHLVGGGVALLGVAAAEYFARTPSRAPSGEPEKTGQRTA